MRKEKIVIIVEGRIVQAVYTEGEYNVEVVNFDCFPDQELEERLEDARNEAETTLERSHHYTIN